MSRSKVNHVKLTVHNLAKESQAHKQPQADMGVCNTNCLQHGHQQTKLVRCQSRSARARDVLVPLRTERVLCSYCPPSGLAACASAQTVVLCILVHSCILRLFCQLALRADTFSSYSLHLSILGCACTYTVGIRLNTHEMRNYKPKSYIGSAYAESDGAFQSRLA